MQNFFSAPQKKGTDFKLSYKFIERNKEFMMKAVQLDGYILKFAGEDLKKLKISINFNYVFRLLFPLGL